MTRSPRHSKGRILLDLTDEFDSATKPWRCPAHWRKSYQALRTIYISPINGRGAPCDIREDLA